MPAKPVDEDAMYSAVVRAGSVGAALGLVGGWCGVLLASRRYPIVRNLTLPMKGFLVTSVGTFTGIIAADHAQRDSKFSVHQQEKNFLQDRETQRRLKEVEALSTSERLMAFARREKYKIICGSWILSMLGSWIIVSRSPMSASQKIVQARVYAQGLTVAVLCGTAAFEIHDQKQGKGFMDAVAARKKEGAAKEEQADLWKTMVDAEEERLKEKDDKKLNH